MDHPAEQHGSIVPRKGLATENAAESDDDFYEWGSAVIDVDFPALKSEETVQAELNLCEALRSWDPWVSPLRIC